MENWDIGFWKRNISDFILIDKARFLSDGLFLEIPSFHYSTIPLFQL